MSAEITDFGWIPRDARVRAKEKWALLRRACVCVCVNINNLKVAVTPLRCTEEQYDWISPLSSSYVDIFAFGRDL